MKSTTLQERLAKLLCIKSIVTILAVLVVLGLSAFRTIAYGEAIADQLWTILATIIAFYFGTQTKDEK